MKIIVSTLLTALMAYVGGLFMEWWSIALAGFVVAIAVHQRAWKALICGFLGVFLLWFGLAYWMDSENQGLLSTKVASLFKLEGKTLLLITITAFIGALVAGLAAMSGSYLRTAFASKRG